MPYLDSGLIDWGKLEDDLPTADSGEEFFLEVVSLGFTKPQPSNLHPYYHSPGDKDCVMVGHRCNCPRCQEIVDVSSPARKRSNTSAETVVIAAAASPVVAAHPQPVVAPASNLLPPAIDAADCEATTNNWTPDSNPDLRMPGSPPPVGLVVSENLRVLVESMADSAEVPLSASKEKSASQKIKGQQKRMRRQSEPMSPLGGSHDGKPLKGDGDSVSVETALAETTPAPAETGPAPVETTPGPAHRATGENKQKTKVPKREKANCKTKGKAKTKAKPPDASGKAKAEAKPQEADHGDDPMVGPPFTLHRWWRPMEKAQCYLCGTVAGEPKKSSPIFPSR